MFTTRPAYIRTAAVIASAVGLSAVGLNKAITSRGYRHIWKADHATLIRGMATASTIHLEARQQAEFFVKGIEQESATVASELLQENHDKHHIFFNQEGFHVRLASISAGLDLTCILLEPYRAPPTDAVRP